MAITHSLRILSGFIPRDTTHFSLHTHTCVPTKNSERPLAYTILIIHLHIKHSKLFTPDTQIRGLKTNLAPHVYSDKIWRKNSKWICEVPFFSFFFFGKTSKWIFICNISTVFLLQDHEKMYNNLISISYLLKRQIRTKISLLKDILQNFIASVF